MAATTSTDEPLSRALPALMRERGLSYRALAAQTREHASDATAVTSGHLANLVSGRNRASAPVLELIATALDVRPEYFANTAWPSCGARWTNAPSGLTPRAGATRSSRAERRAYVSTRA